MKFRVKETYTMPKMPRIRRALLSVFTKDEEFGRLAYHLHRSGFQLIASGGTFAHLKNKLNLPVTDVAEITGSGAALGHRVVTLAEEVHGGLLADEHDHMEELNRLGWPFIDLLVCTFYPLAKTMEEHYGDPKAINNMVDIGGPAMVRSACKGKRTVVVDVHDYEFVIDQMTRPSGIRTKDRDWLRAKAAACVTAYQAMESVFRTNRIRPKMSNAVVVKKKEEALPV